MARQANTPAAATTPTNPPTRSNGTDYRRNGSRTVDNHRNGNGAQGHGTGMTASQRRAIDAIAQRMQVDAGSEAHDLCGLSLDALTIRQASELIDHLKALTPAANGSSSSNGHARG